MATLEEISEQIRNIGTEIIEKFQQIGWSPSQAFSATTGNPASLPITPEIVSEYSEIVALRIERLSKVQLDQDGFNRWLGKLSVQLSQVNVNAIDQGLHAQLSNVLSILQMIDAAIPQLPPKEPKVNWEDIKDQKTLLPRDLARRLRSIEARITELDPRSKEISTKITEIEQAHAAAEQLPTDLAELAESRKELADLIANAQGLADEISNDHIKVGDAREKIFKDIDESTKKIESVLESAEST